MKAEWTNENSEKMSSQYESAFATNFTYYIFKRNWMFNEEKS